MSHGFVVLEKVHHVVEFGTFQGMHELYNWMMWLGIKGSPSMTHLDSLEEVALCVNILLETNCFPPIFILQFNFSCSWVSPLSTEMFSSPFYENVFMFMSFSPFNWNVFFSLLWECVHAHGFLPFQSKCFLLPSMRMCALVEIWMLETYDTWRWRIGPCCRMSV